MTYGRQPRVNDEINWVTDEDSNVLGYMKDDKTLIPFGIGSGKLQEYIGPVGIRSAYPDTFATGTATKYMKGVAIEPCVSDTNIFAPVFSSKCGLGNDESSMLTGTFTGRCFVMYEGQSAWISYGGVPGATGVGQMSGELVPDLNVELPFTVKAGTSVKVVYDLAFFPDGGNRYPYYQDGYNLGYPANGEICITSPTPMAPIVLGEIPTNVGGGNVQTALSFRPFFVLGKTREHTVMLTADSLGRGPVTFNRNVFNDRNGVTGVIPALLAKAGIGYINCSFSGDDYLNASQAGKYTKRGQNGKWVTTWVPALLTNDLGNAATVTVTQATNYMAAVRAQIDNGNNLRVIPATIMARAVNSLYSTPSAFVTNNYFTDQKPQANNAVRVAINKAIRDGTIPSDNFLEVAAYMETVKDSGIQPYPPDARTVTDVVTTNNSNVVDSATAKFNESSTGGRIFILGAGASGAPLSGYMTYVSPTRVNVVSQTGSVVNAGATLSGATAYVNSHDWTDDALHVSPRGRDVMRDRMFLNGEHLKIKN